MSGGKLGEIDWSNSVTYTSENLRAKGMALTNHLLNTARTYFICSVTYLGNVQLRERDLGVKLVSEKFKFSRLRRALSIAPASAAVGMLLPATFNDFNLKFLFSQPNLEQ